MSKLKLVNIRKSYVTGGTKVEALKGVSVDFRKSEFVSILGPSGCGKTTMLNIIGGLDRYDSGDLILNGTSSTKYKDADWDTYRNRSIGFVFQSYNLIAHQSVLQNVEIAMTLSGVSSSERKKRAKQVLDSVGLSDHIGKKPSQLSGGQMQRVAIARALVNNPDIILADEPTGALDSVTSVQVMELLKEIAKDRLVIMVTHNSELAEEYSNRIIRLKDGELISDNNPLTDEVALVEEKLTSKKKKSAMSFGTALTLSFKNLLTKKGRTIITAFAGSIGIIGVALILALSAGLSKQIDNLQSNALSGFPIMISEIAEVPTMTVNFDENKEDQDKDQYTDQDVLHVKKEELRTEQHKNNLTSEYFDYVGKIEKELPEAVNTVSYQRNVVMNLLAKKDNNIIKYDPYTLTLDTENQMFIPPFWQEIPENKDFISSQYDLIGEGSRLPQEKNEIALVVDEYNQIDEAFFKKIGISSGTDQYKLSDFIGKKLLKVVPNNDYYTKTETGIFVPAATDSYQKLFDGSAGVDLTVTGILRIKEGTTNGYLETGIVYTTKLTDYIVDDASKSEIAIAQKNSDQDVLANVAFIDEKAKKSALEALGATTTPTGINIYPKDFESKDSIKTYLDKFNKGKAKADQVVYVDMAQSITDIMGTMLTTVTSVLVGFAAISLIVSTIMIGIITYVSVIERTKEIGILRSVGARKKDVSRVFNAETLIVGFVAGSLGVAISYALTFPINKLIEKASDMKDVAMLLPIHVILLIAGSMVLTLIAGLLPARMAAKKDPVIALRTE